MNIDKNLVYDVSFFIVAVILILLSIWLASSFIGVTIAATLYCLILFPLFQRITRKIKGKPSLVSVLIFILSLFLVIVPITFISIFVVKKIIDTVNSAIMSYNSTMVDVALLRISELLDKLSLGQIVLDPIELRAEVFEKISGLTGAVSKSIQFALGFTFSTVFSFFVFVVLSIIMLPNWNKINHFIKSLVPLKPEIRDLYFRRAKIITLDVIKGTVIISLLQGIVAGVFLFIIGVPNALLFGILVSMASVVPIVGTALVMVPISIYYLIIGEFWMSLGIFLWQILVVSLIGNLVRPFLVSDEVKLHPVIMFLAYLGGVAVFGPFGLILGPLIVVLLITTIEIFQREYLKKDPKDARLFLKESSEDKDEIFKKLKENKLFKNINKSVKNLKIKNKNV